MSKLSRKERKKEEKRIIAEMEAALREEKVQAAQTDGVESASEKNGNVQSETVQEEKKKNRAFYDDVTPEKIHCKRCKTLMENGVCPTCGFRVYVPLEKGKRDKIRLVVTVVCMAVFLVLFLISQIRNG